MDALKMVDLEEAKEIIEEELAGRPTGFKVTDLESANWCLRKIAAYQQKRYEINTLAQKEIDRIMSWAKKENEAIDTSISFFEGLLREYYMEQKEKDPKFKSINTPYGRVSSRKQPAKWEYNEQEVLMWLEANQPEFIRVKKEVDKAAFKKAVKVSGGNVIDENGEVIPGVKVIEQPEKIEIKVVE